MHGQRILGARKNYFAHCSAYFSRPWLFSPPLRFLRCRVWSVFCCLVLLAMSTTWLSACGALCSFLRFFWVFLIFFQASHRRFAVFLSMRSVRFFITLVLLLVFCFSCLPGVLRGLRGALWLALCFMGQYKFHRCITYLYFHDFLSRALMTLCVLLLLLYRARLALWQRSL